MDAGTGAAVSVAVELLRFKWKPCELRVLLAASFDPGPTSQRDWQIKTGVPANHLMETIVELERLRGLSIQAVDPGLVLRVLPVSFWKAKPIVDPPVFLKAWPPNIGQARLDLVTEAPSLTEALCAVSVSGSSTLASALRPIDGRNSSTATSAPALTPSPVPAVLPESGAVSPESGSFGADSSGIRRISTGIRSVLGGKGGNVPNVKRSNVSDLKRETSKRSDAGAREGSEAEALRDEVRRFVGDLDFRKFYERPDYALIFECADRGKVLENSLRYCLAAIKEGVAVQKNHGAMLWDEFKRQSRNRALVQAMRGAAHGAIK
jgi:hypothetical protein